MSSMLEPRRVAELEERRIATGVREIASEAVDWCGGVLCFGGKGSWANQALGCCMDGETARAADVTEMARWYESRGCEPKVVVCPFADRSLVAELGEAGFRLREFEMVFACDVREREVGRGAPAPQGVVFETLDPDDDALVDKCARFSCSIYGKDGEPPEAMIENFRRMAFHPRVRTIVVRADGVLAGTSAIALTGEIAALCGAAVTPEFRRRGIQTALIDHRLDMAREAGCALVTVTSLPGIPTERNAMRRGFLPSYTKVAMMRPGKGLVVSP